MMFWYLFSGGVILYSLFVVIRRIANKQRNYAPKKPNLRYMTPPKGVGLALDVNLSELEERLEKAFSAEYGDQLKQRVLSNHPDIDSDEYDWLLIELKRYFLMTALLREVPMFSTKVDHIWHEMLMYSREYQRFCEAFAGRIIHHAPHAEPRPMEGERAWFDWMYSQLFDINAFSVYCWKGFYRHPLPTSFLDRLEQESHGDAIERLFHVDLLARDTSAQTTVNTLLNRLRSQIKDGRSKRGYHPHKATQPADLVLLAPAFVYLSMNAETTDSFHHDMHQLQQPISPDRSSGSSSGCGGSGCSSSDSSCGGGSGCGSGCGGS